MRIAQIAPLYESVPPKLYGGTERVVHFLTEELVKRGHEVTLFASADSRTKADLIACSSRSLRMHSGYELAEIPHVLMMEKLRKRAKNFDLLHFHTDVFHFPILRTLSVPSVTTIHGRIDRPQYAQLYQEYKEFPLISISESQRAPLPWANWGATIHHGLPKYLYNFSSKPGSYAAFLGRLSRDKGPDRAIEITRRAGVPLKMAAKADALDKEYYETEIKPLLARSPHVEFIGEITDAEKNEFLGNASVLLTPIDWPEPFGLVMIEAMACGTPVIAFCHGSVPELIRNGVTGFIVSSVDEAVERIADIPKIDRFRCRRSFEEFFSLELFTNKHLALYEKLIIQSHTPSKEYLSLVKPGGMEWKTSSSSITKSI